jgi:elongation factor G
VGYIFTVSISGHVDFTFEVERSLQVLDGAVAIFDASAGVEPQTISVWRQANRYKVPRIAFFNKMDKPNSHFHEAVVSLREKLPDTVPLLTQYPIGRGKDFSGVVDLVSMEMLLWRPDDGGEVIVRPLSWHQSKDLEDFVGLNSFMTSSLAEEIFHAREQLIEQLAMHDDVIMEKVLSNDCHSFQLDEQVLRTSLKKATCDIESGCVPLLFGSSLKNKGIQPLLDAVIDYLPSPVEKSFVM